MASTLTKILIHVTFSTKDRMPLIPENLEKDLYAYTGGICRRMESPLLAMGGVSDHVHMMISLGKMTTVAGLMMEVKRDSSRWMKSRVAGEFEWQDGYFAFSIGESAADPLRRYIADQKEHHKTIDFKDEVKSFLRKYGVEWDEQHIWT